MYTTRDRVGLRPYYSEKEYLLTDRFYPGELGMVILLAVASLLVWSLCIYGIMMPEKRLNDVGYTGYSDSYTAR